MRPSSTFSFRLASSRLASSAWLQAFRFFGRATLFAAPLLLAAGLAEGLLAAAGESQTVARSVASLERDPGTTLYSRGLFAQQSGLFKWRTVAARRPEILVVGSSRVLQLRGFLFAPLAAETYNAGSMLQSVEDLHALATAIADGRVKRPRALIAGLDPWWFFADRRREPSPWLDGNLGDVVQDPAAHAFALRRLAVERHLWPLLHPGCGRSPSGVRRVGLEARRARGFRGDGSRQYDPAIVDEVRASGRFRDREDPPVIERIRRGLVQFAPTSGIDPKAVVAVRAAFATLRELGVDVLAWLPPFSDEAYAALEASPRAATWWPFYRDRLPALLTADGVATVPVSRPADTGLDDLAMYDGFHPGEVLMARLLADAIARLPDGHALAAVDRDRLEAILAEIPDPPLLLRPPRSGGRFREVPRGDLGARHVEDCLIQQP